MLRRDTALEAYVRRSVSGHGIWSSSRLDQCAVQPGGDADLLGSGEWDRSLPPGVAYPRLSCPGGLAAEARLPSHQRACFTPLLPHTVAICLLSQLPCSSSRPRGERDLLARHWRRFSSSDCTFL